jgi:negative regulator of genetic competence, sporulation and motility
MEGGSSQRSWGKLAVDVMVTTKEASEPQREEHEMTEDDGKTTNGSNGHSDDYGAEEQKGTYVVEYKPLATVIEYKTKKRVTLADQLEEIHKKLFDNDRYRSYMNLKVDLKGKGKAKFETADAVLAMMMIDYANERGITLDLPEDSDCLEHAVKLKMRVAWKRFEGTARTDRMMIKFVPAKTSAPPPAE